MRCGRYRIADLDWIGAGEPILEDTVSIAAAWERPRRVGQRAAGARGTGARAVALDADRDRVVAGDWLGHCRLADAELIGKSCERAVRRESAVLIRVRAPNGIVGAIIDRELDAKCPMWREPMRADIPLKDRTGSRFPGSDTIPDGTGRGGRRRVARGGEGIGWREHDRCKAWRWVVGTSIAGSG